MDLRTLRAFVEVVKAGGFSRAADSLFSTQSTVSKAIKQLEDELGAVLLDRLGRRSKLTAAGEIVYRRAQAILLERKDLIAELSDLSGLKSGSLRIGFSVGSSILFASLFAEFRQRHPGIDVRFALHSNKHLKEKLFAGELDLAAMLLPVSEELEWQHVHVEPLMVVMAKDHPLATLEKLELKGVADVPFILFEEDYALNEVILDACKRRGITARVAARSRQIDFIVELAALGVGVAFLPRMLLERRYHPSIRFALLDEPHTQWRIALAWRRGAYLSHAAQEWLALTREMHATDVDPTLEPTAQGA